MKAPQPQASPLVGVLALQGGFQAHERLLHSIGARTRQVRVSADLDGIQALVLPGGESTSMMFGIAREQLEQPLRRLIESGLPVLASCAGLILLDRDHLGLMDIRAERNAFGRQIRSFESDIQVQGISGGPLRAIFIRAPWIAEYGPSVQVLAELDGHPVAARQAAITAVAFHTELADDDRLHRALLEQIPG